MKPDRSSSPARKQPRVKEVTRFVIRVTGSRPWRWNPGYEAMLLIERTLKKLLAEQKLELDLSHLRTPPQSITAIDLFEVELDVPVDGAQAHREGFLRQENPFRREADAYRAWRNDYDGAKKWSVRE